MLRSWEKIIGIRSPFEATWLVSCVVWGERKALSLRVDRPLKRLRGVLGDSDLTSLELRLELSRALLAVEDRRAALEMLRAGQELMAEELPESHPMALDYAEAPCRPRGSRRLAL